MKKKEINTIEEFLSSKRKHPVFSLKLARDMARRIKGLEKIWKKKRH